MYGRKRAVLCGVSYFGQKASLKGSLNDATSMKKFLLSTMGFPNASIIVLTGIKILIFQAFSVSLIQRHVEISLKVVIVYCFN